MTTDRRSGVGGGGAADAYVVSVASVVSVSVGEGRYEEERYVGGSVDRMVGGNVDIVGEFVEVEVGEGGIDSVRSGSESVEMHE